MSSARTSSGRARRRHPLRHLIFHRRIAKVDSLCAWKFRRTRRPDRAASPASIGRAGWAGYRRTSPISPRWQIPYVLSGSCHWITRGRAGREEKPPVTARALKSCSRRSGIRHAGVVMCQVQTEIRVGSCVLRWPTPRVRSFRVDLRTGVDSKRWSARTSFGVRGRLLP